MSEPLRVFIAVDPPAAAAAAATRAIGSLRRAGVVARWVDPGQMHMTLHFLGAVDESQLVGLSSAIDRACARCVPFSLAWGGLGVFPDRARPRTIWIGVTHGATEVARLHAALGVELAALGFPAESRRYHPHLTLGRLPGSRGPDPAAARIVSAQLDRLADLPAGEAEIDAVVLYRSRPHGAGRVYEPLHLAPLTGGGDA